MTTQDFFEKYSQNLSYRVEGLANCESEQISRIGAIQPFGFFLACRGRDLEIAGASQNLAEFLGLPLEKLLGSKLVSILKLPTLESIDEDAFRRATLRGPVQAVLLRNGSEVAGYTASVHRVNDDLCVDIEPVIPGGSGEYPVAYIQDLVASLNEQDQLAEIADTVAVRFRTLTKFDRVMIYRFLDSWDGEVIGESKNEGLEPVRCNESPSGFLS